MSLLSPRRFLEWLYDGEIGTSELFFRSLNPTCHGKKNPGFGWTIFYRLWIGWSAHKSGMRRGHISWQFRVPCIVFVAERGHMEPWEIWRCNGLVEGKILPGNQPDFHMIFMGFSSNFSLKPINWLLLAAPIYVWWLVDGLSLFHQHDLNVATPSSYWPNKKQ